MRAREGGAYAPSRPFQAAPYRDDFSAGVGEFKRSHVPGPSTFTVSGLRVQSGPVTSINMPSRDRQLRMRPLCGYLGVLCALLSACATPDRNRDLTEMNWQFDSRAPVSMRWEFDVPESLALGFQPPCDRGVAPGDQVLLAVAFVSNGRRVDRFLSLELDAISGAPDDLTSVHEVLVTVFDERGEQLSSAEVTTDGMLFRGFLPAIERCQREGDWVGSTVVSTEHGAVFERTPLGVASGSIVTVTRIIKKCPALLSELWHVVDKPSLLSMLGGVELRSYANFPESYVKRVDGRAVSCDLPLQLWLNDTEALNCRLRTVDPQGAGAVCGGIVEILGYNPQQPQRVFCARLVGTKGTERR